MEKYEKLANRMWKWIRQDNKQKRKLQVPASGYIILIRHDQMMGKSPNWEAGANDEWTLYSLPTGNVCSSYIRLQAKLENRTRNERLKFNTDKKINSVSVDIVTLIFHRMKKYLWDSSDIIYARDLIPKHLDAFKFLFIIRISRFLSIWIKHFICFHKDYTSANFQEIRGFS